MIDVRDDQLKVITDILAALVPDAEVWAFGSRVVGTARKPADLDLVVIGKAALDWKVMTRLKAAFEDSNLPFRVDVLDWHIIPEDFRVNIGKRYEVVRKAG